MGSHDKGVFIEIQAADDAQGGDSQHQPAEADTAADQQQGQGEDVSDGHAAHPKMATITAVADFVGCFCGDFTGVGYAKFTQQRDKQVNNERDGQCQYGNITHCCGRTGNQPAQYQKRRTAHHEGLHDEMEGQQRTLPQVAPFSLGEEEGGVHGHANGQGQA